MHIHKKTLTGALIIIVFILGYVFFTQFYGDLAGSRAVLEAPAADVTPEEQAEYTASVERLAEEAAVLEIGRNCTMTPLVLKFVKGKTLTIQNDDAVPHTIAFEDQNFFSISAGRSREIDLVAIFGKGDGIYRYRCSDISNEDNVGVIYIVE